MLQTLVSRWLWHSLSLVAVKDPSKLWNTALRDPGTTAKEKEWYAHVEVLFWATS